MLRKVFGEKYKQPNIGLIYYLYNLFPTYQTKNLLKFDHWNKLKLKG